MKFTTVAAMVRIEELENQRGVSYYDMMTEAGNRAAQLICARAAVRGQRVTVLCGKGNNGGDGMVVAARLCEAGAEVTVALVHGEPAASSAKQALDDLPKGVAVARDPRQKLAELLDADLLVDAVYGIGFSGRTDPADAELFGLCQSSRALRVSLDVPSGVQGDSGRFTSHFPAELTIVMALPKGAHLVSWSRAVCGELMLAETRLTRAGQESGLLLTSLAREHCTLPQRRPWSHKGDNGRLAVVCGSRQFTGAAVLACSAALRTGVGYVRLLSTQAVCDRVANACPEVILCPLPESPQGGIDAAAADQLAALCNQSDAVLAGCGLGNTPHTAQLVHALLADCQKPLLLDADALNVLAENPAPFAHVRCPVAITPHPGEFLRLASRHIHDADGDCTLAAARFSAEAGITLLLKGAVTGIFRGRRQPVFSFMGNDGLAKGGSGDLLSGIIGSLMAQGQAPEQAVLCGAWLHGRAAELAEQELNRRYMLPSDLLEYLCDALDELEPSDLPLLGG